MEKKKNKRRKLERRESVTTFEKIAKESYMEKRKKKRRKVERRE